ncbi:HAMP domain-containing histidine kinase [Priestia megaterium]|nr:HAMP domain-containing histidine kinase [Priestia megaterium]
MGARKCKLLIRSILKNKEFKVHIFLLTLSIVILTSATNYYITKVYESIHHEWESRNMAVLGVILDEKPELEEEVIPLFTKEITREEAQKGYDLAKKYGFSLSLSDINKPFMYETLEKTRISVAFLASLCLIILILLSFRIFHHIYAQIRDLSLGVEKIMNGNFHLISLTQEEGDLPLLRFQFNQMAERLKNTLDRLGQEKVLLKNLISDISHQLKTPLSSSLMFHDFLIDDPDLENRIDFLSKSKQQLERIHWLIKQLLNLSKLESGIIQFNMKNNPIHSTVEEAILSLQQKIETKNISIQFDNFKEPIYFHHDEKWLGEALKNILNNAIDYSEPHGKITFELERKPNFLSIAIKDQGIGISKDDLPHIFERFYQARLDSPSVEGTGIGLALAKSIVNKHEGRIEVRSAGINKGTTFILTFPI